MICFQVCLMLARVILTSIQNLPIVNFSVSSHNPLPIFACAQYNVLGNVFIFLIAGEFSHHRRFSKIDTCMEMKIGHEVSTMDDI